MYLDLGRLRIRAGFPFFAWIAFLVCGGGAGLLPLLFLFALLHEAGHVAALLAFGARRVSVSLFPGGAAIRGGAAGALSYPRAFVAAAAGPAVNLAAALLFWLLRGRLPPALAADALRLNLLLGAANLLPLSFLDGGVAASALFCALRKPPRPPDPFFPDLGILLLLCGACVFTLAARRPAWHLLAFTGYCLIYEFSLPLRASYDKIKQ